MSPSTDRPASRPRRADAERNVARILDAAVDVLARDPEAGMAGIARHAGVARATVYVHFPTRESLIAAVTHRAIEETTRVIADAEPDRGDPIEALRRVIGAAWRALGRYHALVEVNTRLAPAEMHERHAPALAALEPLLRRGQQAGVFRADVAAAWHTAVILAVIHAASAEVRAGRATDVDIEPVLADSIVGALTAVAR